jgi:epoxyqueuosine reductase
MGGTRQPTLRERIAAHAQELGFDTVGFCSAEPPKGIDFYDQWLKEGKHGTMSYLARNRQLRADPQRLLEAAKSVIAVTLNYNQPNPAQKGMPRIARYALGRDYHKVLRQKLKRLTEEIAKEEPDAGFRICVDSAPVLEREFANRAGLGWFGKNTMLIDSKRGSWFFIGIVLTTLELEPDKPTKGGCGTCTKCIDACPTSAIVHDDGRWQVDARKCISYLTIEHKGEIDTDLHGWTFGCDVCQEVCPFNEPNEKQPLRATTTTTEDFLAKREWPSLKQLTVIREEDWDVLTRGSPVRRTGLVSLRRIAHVGLTKPRGKT